MSRRSSNSPSSSSSSEPAATRSLVNALLEWFAREARDLPWRHTLDPYATWVSEIMLQQTQVKTVIPYWQRWLRELPTVRALAAAPPEAVLKLWEGLGYYTRACNLQKAAQQIVREHDGRFPSDFDAILGLPGVGRYTAGAISSIAFNQPRPILDGNVIRVLTRLHGIEENPREKATNAALWSLAEALVQMAERVASKLSASSPPFSISGSCSALNQSLMELGALICTPRQPRCEACPLRRDCVALRNNRVAQLPNLGPRTVATDRRFAAFIVERDGACLVHQRPAGVVNARLWEFPNVELEASHEELPIIAAKVLGARKADIEPFVVIRHSITRYRISLEAYRATAVSVLRAKQQIEARWLPLAELDALPFTSAHRKILRALLRDAASSELSPGKISGPR